MNSLPRLAVCTCFLGLFFVGAYAFCSAVVEVAGPDLAEWIRCWRTFDSETGRGEELSQQCQYALERHQAKNQIARDLIAGRLSLAEAAARFAELPHPSQRMREMLRFYHGTAATDEEIMSQHVIDWACLLLEEEPARAAAVRHRLENEWRAQRHDTHDRP
jgi:hypothetical protein